MEKIVSNLTDLEAEAESLVKKLTPKEDGATFVTLSGELGAGKTAFVKAVAKALGVTDTVNSPTFVLEKVYDLPGNSSFKKLIHIDAYRLLKGADLNPLGFKEMMKDMGNLVMLEWPERVEDALPNPDARIRVTPHEDGSRTISYG